MKTFTRLDMIITKDGKWCLYMNDTSKKSWLNVDKISPVVPKQEMHQYKVMLSVWWNIHGRTYEGISIIAKVYCDQLQPVADIIFVK